MRAAKIIHPHKDVWISKNAIAKAQLLVQSGKQKKPKRIFTQKTIARCINVTEARMFLIWNHMWGATKAKHHYGLFRTRIEDEDQKPRRRRRRTTTVEEELVAVATYSKCRNVRRGNDNRLFCSFELLRYCSLKDSTVVGGISKLYKKFIRDVQPDDIVTLVDRDWGAATGWHTSLPFETMTVLDPLVMVVSPLEPGVRRYLVGRGLRNAEIFPPPPAIASSRNKECNSNPAQLARSSSFGRL